MTKLPIIYSPEYLAYNFGPGHPFTPARWDALSELLRHLGLPLDWTTPQPASEDTIRRVHSGDFVSAVQAASEATMFLHPGFFGLGTGDVPTFLGMHEASAWIVGGSLEAGRRVEAGPDRRVMQLGGGLHHAMRDRASGFCVYNDAALLIDSFVREEKRVAYIDIDVHHGDGVQAIFYDEPAVLTISMHESGRYLFPGTGFVEETGGDGAEGTSINIPLFPGTADASYIDAFDAVIPDSLRVFAPDVLVLEAGADAHDLDPLAHLCLTVDGYARLFDRIITLADEITAGKLVCVLGGGYAFDSTLRIWASLACKLSGTPEPDRLPSTWLDRWSHRLSHPEWTAWNDEPYSIDPESVRHASGENMATVQGLREILNGLSKA